MFERFSDSARRVVVSAQEEAHEFGHNYIGTEHLLLGVLANEGDATAVLQQLGLDLATARAKVELVIGRGDARPQGHIPFTPRAKKVLEDSLRVALHLNEDHIGTAHILLALVREGDGVAAQIIESIAGLTTVEDSLYQRLGQEPPPRARRRRPWQRRRPPGASTGPAPWSHTRGTAAVLDQAARRAGGFPVGTDTLLEAMLLTDDTVAARALESLGVTPDRLHQVLASVSSIGTLDERPGDRIARSIEVREEGDRIVIALDGDAADRVRGLTPQQIADLLERE